MHVQLVATTQDGFLKITSDPKFASYKFEIGDEAWDSTVPLVGCIDVWTRTVDLKISSVAREFGITPEEVVERHQAGTLFACDDGLKGENIVLCPEVEAFLSEYKQVLLEQAAKDGKIIHLSRTLDGVPASMNIIPDGFIFVNEKSYDQGSSGAFKVHKTAVMINSQDERLRVARMVANPEKKMKRTWRRAFGVSWHNAVTMTWYKYVGSLFYEALTLSELQKGQHQERLYGMIAGKNKRGEDILTLYVENFPDGDLHTARCTPAEKITSMGQAIASLAELHELRCAHNDVKRANMLYNRGTGRALVADHGFASRADDGNTDPDSGTLVYWSPEKITAYRENLPWTHEDKLRDDVWALGASLYEHFIAVDYRSKVDPVTVMNLYGKDYSLLEAGIPGVPLPIKGNPVHELIKMMLHPDPAKRPAMAEVLEVWQAIEEGIKQGHFTPEDLARPATGNNSPRISPPPIDLDDCASVSFH